MSASTETSDALTATKTRRVARLAVGPALPFLLHLRPAEWPIVTAHMLVGWLLARGIATPDSALVIGAAAWVVGLNGGTLALNSAFDRDEGDVAYLRNPPRPPRGLAWFALVLMLAGAAVTWNFPVAYRIAYGACALLSVAYSVPPVRLKAVGGVDWVINMIGFGTLTPFAGWALTGISVHREDALLLAAFCPLFAALYPLTQIYQMDEDRDRGDSTFVIRLGAHRALAVAVVSATFAFALFAVAAVLTQWPDRSLYRWAAIVIAALAWCAVLVPWVREGRLWSSAEHQRAMYHALGAWAITDAAVIVAWCL